MKLLMFILTALYSISISAQPFISSFTPSSGPVGTTVTINGTSFSNTAAANTVYFGTVRANIVAASVNSLTVKVPYGASYQSISVTTNGLTAYSSKPFIVTFTGGGFINESSFAAKVDSSTGLNPYTVIAGDIDGDGNQDLLTANRDSNNISILRSNTLNGSISFEYQNNLACTFNPYTATLTDFDGDGKLDIAAATYNGFSVFHNTSTPGNISFDARQDYTSNIMGFFRDISCADFDGDGKPDIALGASGSYIVSVFRNTSSGSISFESPVGLSSFSPNAILGSFCVRAIDMDGDTKPDIAFTYTGPYFSTMINTSTPGNISFTPPLTDFALPSASSARGMAVGDMNNDDKPDVIIADHFTDTISIFKNNSINGTISFGTRIDIAAGGSPRSLAVNDLDGDGKVEVVCVNVYFQPPSLPPLTVFKNISTGDSIKLGRPVYFSPAQGAWSISLTDFNRDGKADIATASSGASPTVSILRNKIGETLSLCTGGNTSIVAGVNGTNYQWQVSTDSVTFSDRSNNTNYSGAATSTLQLNGIPSSWYGRQYRCMVDGSYSSIFTIVFENRWTGVVNSSWEEPGNWACGVLPDMQTDVFINSGTVILNSNAAIRSLHLNPDANLTVNDGYSLTVIQ